MKTTLITLIGAFLNVQLACCTSSKPLLASHRSKGGSLYRSLAFDSTVFNLALGSCDSGEVSCEGGCIPSSGHCCYYGDGGWCDPGDYCLNGGCCEQGETCVGTADDCGVGKESCGYDYCMPSGSVCCLDGKYCDEGYICGTDKCIPEDAIVECGDGSYCDEGEECTKTGCIPEGTVDCGDKTYCDAGEECTKTGCIPEGSVDCGNRKYCDAGYVCSTNGDGKCRKEGSDDDEDEDTDGGGGGGTGGDDGSDDNPEPTTEVATTAKPTTSKASEKESSTTTSAESDEESSTTSSTDTTATTNKFTGIAPNGLGQQSTTTEPVAPETTTGSASEPTETNVPDMASSLRTTGPLVAAGLFAVMAFVV